MSRCEKPIIIRNKSVTRGGVQVPCGRCASCMARAVSNWSYRLLQEDKQAETSYFVTLTYGNDRIPISKAGWMDLSKRDLQLFFKRLRKWHDTNGSLGKPLKYYAVGEYGGKFRRPHYHIILFNAKLSALIGDRYAAYAERGLIELDGKSEYDCEIWGYQKTVIKVPTLKYIKKRDEYKVVFRRSVKPAEYFGHITVGQVSGASVGYTMKYISKTWRPMHKNDDRTPQFSTSSNGLGKSYLTPEMIAWHKADMLNRQYCVLQDGKKISMPRYYKTLMNNLQEKEILKALNVLENMKPKEESKLTSLEKSEAMYAGINRYNIALNKNQKL